MVERINESSTLSMFIYLKVELTICVYTLSLHDALPICARGLRQGLPAVPPRVRRDHDPGADGPAHREQDLHRSEEHTLNSSHITISYAVFCLKKNNTISPVSHLRPALIP